MSVNWRLERSFAKTGSTLRFISQMSRSSTARVSGLELDCFLKLGLSRRAIPVPAKLGAVEWSTSQNN